jgi:hypothetical protein
MRDQTLLYWGMVVTMFLLIAGMITARDVFEMYMEKRASESKPSRRQAPAD